MVHYEVLLNPSQPVTPFIPFAHCYQYQTAQFWIRNWTAIDQLITETSSNIWSLFILFQGHSNITHHPTTKPFFFFLFFLYVKEQPMSHLQGKKTLPVHDSLFQMRISHWVFCCLSGWSWQASVGGRRPWTCTRAQSQRGWRNYLPHQPSQRVGR